MSATPAEIARRWFDEVWNQRKASAIYELSAPKIVGHMAHGQIETPSAFEAVWKDMFALLPDLALEVQDVVGDEKSAVVRWRLTGTATGSALGISQTGQRADALGMTWLRIENGKVVEGWDAWNSGGTMAKLATPLA